MKAEVSLQTIQQARERIAGRVLRTPLLSSEWLNQRFNAELFFKCENLQPVGAFKVRGATNAVFALSAAQLAGGVVTHSSGNHGAAVARAARLRGVTAFVVMPENSSPAKLQAVRHYGGELILCEPTLAAREAEARRIVEQTGAAFVHPYDDPQVISGQGTIGLELLEEQPGLDLLLCPVGGGGLTSGLSIAAKALRPQIRVIGVEPAGADDAQRSFVSGVLTRGGTPHTIADGLRGALSERTFDLLRTHVDDVLTVSEESIVSAMRELWEQLKLTIEPSSAVPYAAILENQIPIAGLRVAIVLTGGNVDLDRLPWQAHVRSA